MNELPRFRLADVLVLVVVLAAAAGSRAWYLADCANNGTVPAALQVQGPPPRPDYEPGTKLRGRAHPHELDALIHNLNEHRGYGSLAPLADKDEETAHRAPGYPWVISLVDGWVDDAEHADQVVRWGQCGLGALTAACYFFFARRAFRSRLVGALSGLACALYPFWIINAAELNDGVLATFLLAAGVMLGTRGSQVGGAFTSLLFGLAMAGLAMVRAALLPFTVVAMLWYLLRCRKLKKGWFAALLAFLGFANGLAPWAVRNFQTFGEPVPVADSAFWHLWMGNNPKASGGPLEEKALRYTLTAERRKELTGEANQARRYRMLGQDIVQEIADEPSAALRRRLWAGLYFVYGEHWFNNNYHLSLYKGDTPQNWGGEPPWLTEIQDGLLLGSLLWMLVFGFLGWRWTYGWRKQSRLATLAVIWIPLPYFLSHAERLSGPRLPLDGVLLCYAAFALVFMLPGVGRPLRRGPGNPEQRRSEE